MMNKLHLMDCMEGMAKFPDKYFELAIVDPPYGIGEDGLKNHSRGCKAISTKYIPKTWDKKKPDKIYFEELFRVSKNQIIFGGNYFIDYLKSASCFIIWNKDNGRTDFADAEIAWTSFNTAIRIFKFRWQGMLQGNMKNKERRIHPTQKPVALYRWILQNYAKEGDKILDTHVGSGSSLIACIEEGFEYCGFEIDKDYYENAVKRIKDIKDQGRLF